MNSGLLSGMAALENQVKSWGLHLHSSSVAEQNLYLKVASKPFFSFIPIHCFNVDYYSVTQVSF